MVRESTEAQTYGTLSTFFVVSLISLSIGMYIRGECKVCEQNIILKNEDCKKFSENSNADPLIMGSINTFAAHEFACDPGRAYEELSRLQKRSVDLESSKTKQANRARTATMTRKAGEAGAAKAAFRSCVGLMMPELLVQWDSDFKGHKLHKGSWSARKETDIGGITKEVLEKTAMSLDM